MNLSPRTPASRLVLLIAVLCLVSPLAAWSSRFVIHFAADFDIVPGREDSSDALDPKVGSIGFDGGESMFETVLDGSGEGVLVVSDNGLVGEGRLVATLDPAYHGSEVRIRASITPQTLDSTFIVRAEDADDGTMIDIDWSGTGLGVNGNIPGGGGGGSADDDPGATLLPYEVGVAYDMVVTLRFPFIGPATYELELDSANGHSESSGTLDGIDAEFELDRLLLVRPADAGPGVFVVDDVIVDSTELPGFGN